MLVEAIGAVVIALLFCVACSFLAEPTRQQFNAVFVGGAGATYLNGAVGALGIAEFAFTAVICACAVWGLRSYRWIGIAWLLHVAWDIVHHAVGEPIVGLDPLSSFGCAICDSLLAVWFFRGAPPLLGRALSPGADR